MRKSISGSLFGRKAVKGRHARLIRKDDQASGGATGTAENNPTGNSSGAGTENQPGNNAGQTFDPNSFWNTPAPERTGSPSEGSAESGTPGAGNQPDRGTQLGQEFAQTLQSMTFSPAFTPEVATQIADGNLEGINGAMNQLGQDAVRNSLQLSARMMQAYGSHLMEQVESMIQSRFGDRDNNSALESEFPQIAQNPAMRPVVEQIFGQAMKLSQGNRKTALAQTREMLKFMSTGVSTELGLNNAPGNPHGDTTEGVKSLIDELLSFK